ncbi:MAG: hypothetical protein L0387_41960 [Acidobacteria bacterium]|nr:hypothetical protein [Acidobacteriota bacterium]
MITGFNTDVKHADTVYHVQTEDKGLHNPLILSLIYVKGTILDAFRTRYQDFLGSARFSEALLQKILEFQHRQIVTAIKRGRYKKGMALEAYVEGDFVFELLQSSEPSSQRKPEPAPEPVKAPVHVPDPRPTAINPAEPSLSRAASPSFESSPVPSQPQLFRSRLSSPLLQVPEPTPSVSPNTLAMDISELSGEQGVEICVEGAKDFVAGEEVDLQLYIQSRQGRLRLENVQVVIKIIGTTFSPRLYAGKTDRFGNLRMNFSLPTFSGGSAALIVQVSTSIGNDEVKYLVRRRR